MDWLPLSPGRPPPPPATSQCSGHYSGRCNDGLVTPITWTSPPPPPATSQCSGHYSGRCNDGLVTPITWTSPPLLQRPLSVVDTIVVGVMMDWLPLSPGRPPPPPATSQCSGHYSGRCNDGLVTPITWTSPPPPATSQCSGHYSGRCNDGLVTPITWTSPPSSSDLSV